MENYMAVEWLFIRYANARNVDIRKDNLSRRGSECDDFV